MSRNGARLVAITLAIFTLAAACSWAQANGNLQLHFIDVGQGDGALMITPSGKIALFDAGMDLGVENCTKISSYLEQLGITTIDAVIVSHYHTDHIGCLTEVLENRTLTGNVYDRGKSYTTQAYKLYDKTLGSKRHTAQAGDTITLDSGANAVTLRVVAVNGAGVPTTNEISRARIPTITRTSKALSPQRSDRWMSTRFIIIAANTARMRTGCESRRPQSESSAQAMPILTATRLPRAWTACIRPAPSSTGRSEATADRRPSAWTRSARTSSSRLRRAQIPTLSNTTA